MFKRLLQLVLLMTTPVYAQVTFTYPALSTPNVWTNSNTFTAPVIFNSSVMASCGVLTTVAGVLTCGGYTPAHGGANSDITSLSGLTTALSTGQGGTGATTAAQALANLGGAPLTGTGTSGTWPISTTGNAATASIATNIAGGTGYEIPVQTGANTTGFVTGGTGLLYQSSAGSMPIVTSSPYVTANANPYDASSQAANDLYVQNAVNLTMATSPFTITGGTISFNSLGSGSTLNYSVTSGAITTINSWMATGANYLVGDVITPQAGNYDAMIRITAVNGSNQPTAGTILYGGTGYSAGTAVAGTAANTIEFTFLLSGTLTSNATLIMAHGTYLTQSNQWIFANNTTGAYTVTVCVGGATDACSGGRTYVVPQGTNNNREEFLQTDGELNVDLAGVIDARDLLNGVTGTGNIVLANSPTLNSPALTGNVHIGTPSYSNSPLTINGIGPWGQLSLMDIAATSEVAGVGIEGSAGGIITGSALGDLSIFTNGSKVNFSANNGTSIQMALLTNGNVGIGTASPGALLEVNGTAKIDSTLALPTLGSSSAALCTTTGGVITNSGCTALNVSVLTFGYAGTPSASQYLGSVLPTTLTYSVASGCTSSYAYGSAASTTTDVFQINKCTAGEATCSSVGTVTFTSSATGVFSCSSGFTIAPGQSLNVTGPATATIVNPTFGIHTTHN